MRPLGQKSKPANQPKTHPHETWKYLSQPLPPISKCFNRNAHKEKECVIFGERVDLACEKVKYEYIWEKGQLSDRVMERQFTRENYMLTTSKHLSQVHELRTFAPTQVTKTPEDNRAFVCTVEHSCETKFHTETRKIAVNTVSRFCSAPWSLHHKQSLQTGCYAFLDQINLRWAPALPWSSVIPFCSSKSDSWRHTLDCYVEM